MADESFARGYMGGYADYLKPRAAVDFNQSRECLAEDRFHRRFYLYRREDVSGVSGTGVVAYGVQFPDGAVAIRWAGDHPSTVIWGSLAGALAVHGHEGRTSVIWLDDDDAPERPA